VKKTIVIGLGNPIISDDSIGLRVVTELEKDFSDIPSLDFVHNYRGGISLMEEMFEYDEAIIIDAIVSDRAKPGSVYKLSIDEAVSTRNIASTHDIDLISALKLGELGGYKLPKDIQIWGIEAKDIVTFSEDLTPELQKALPEVVREIKASIEKKTVEYILESKGGQK